MAFWVLAVCIAGWPARAHAQAVANCSVTTSFVAFGTYDPLRAEPVDSTGNVQVSCSLLGTGSSFVSYHILLSTGRSGSFVPRKMASGSNTLNYNLFIDVSRSAVWGDSNAGTSAVSSGIPLTLGMRTVTKNYPIYGRVFAGQDVPAGTYSDVITVTVNY